MRREPPQLSPSPPPNVPSLAGIAPVLRIAEALRVHAAVREPLSVVEAEVGENEAACWPHRMFVGTKMTNMPTSGFGPPRDQHILHLHLRQATVHGANACM